MLAYSSVPPPPRYNTFHSHNPSFNYTITPCNILAVTYSGACQPTSMLAYSQGVKIPTKSLRWSLEGALFLWVCDFFLTPSNIIREFVYGGEGRINSLS